MTPWKWWEHLLGFVLALIIVTLFYVVLALTDPGPFVDSVRPP